MTRYEALIKTRQLWSYLQTHQDCTRKSKAYLELKMIPDINLCPCCQHASRVEDGYRQIECKKCVLKTLWPRGGCMTSNSAYTVWWEHRGTKQGAQAAGRIVAACTKLIQEYEEGT